MTHEKNPYRWDFDQPRHVVRRQELLDRVVNRIGSGESGYLVGCRGMGKSVFLNQLENELRGRQLEVLVFRTPGVAETVSAPIHAVASKMIESCRARGASDHLLDELERHAQRGRLRELFRDYLVESPNDSVILLYDELDRYAPFGRSFFNELEDVRKSSDGSIVVFAAGGLGLVALDTLLGSSFFSRLTPEILEPFDETGIARLAEPFEARGTPLPQEVLEALRLASGGNLGLTTFGLQQMWSHEAPSPQAIAEVFGIFRDKHNNFLELIRGPLFDADLSDAPELVWLEMRRSGGQMSRQDLLEIMAKAKGQRRIKEQWVFNMLRSTGLIRATDGAYRRPLVNVEIIPSILTFEVPNNPNIANSLREQLVADLCDVLGTIHRMSPDFFRSPTKAVKEILPEAVFAAALVLGLEPRGWKVEREAQSAAGRTDIKARHVNFGERYAVVEVKIWRAEEHHGSIHAQVTSYWSDGVEALATVMVADVQGDGWSNAYESQCLNGKVPSHRRREPPGQLAGHFVAATSGCPVAEVDHFLLRLVRRDR